MKDKATGQSAGSAFITYETHQAAALALQLSGHVIYGKARTCSARPCVCVCFLLAQPPPSARALSPRRRTRQCTLPHEAARRRTRQCTPPREAVHAAARGRARQEPRAAEAGGARAQELRVSWAFQKDKAEDTATHFHIFVGNLSGNVTDPALLEAFKAAGSCSDARVMWDHATGRSKGYGFVSFRRGPPGQVLSLRGRAQEHGCSVPDKDRRNNARVLSADIACRGHGGTAGVQHRHSGWPRSAQTVECRL